MNTKFEYDINCEVKHKCDFYFLISGLKFPVFEVELAMVLLGSRCEVMF